MVDEKAARLKTEWGGKTFYFCSPICLAEFKADPTEYVG